MRILVGWTMFMSLNSIVQSYHADAGSEAVQRGFASNERIVGLPRRESGPPKVALLEQTRLVDHPCHDDQLSGGAGTTQHFLGHRRFDLVSGQRGDH